MVRQIHLAELRSFDNSELGGVPSESDYTELIDEDVDVYKPDGTLAVAFRKKGVKSAEKIVAGTPEYNYWRWACRSLLSDQRGNAAGAEITTNVEIRLTEGQRDFFAKAVKGEIQSLEEALEIVNSDKRVSRSTYYVGKAEADGLVDLEEIEKWDSLVRKKATPFDLKKEATLNRNAAKLAWFDNWLRNVWDKAEDKAEAAKAGKKRYVTSQPRGQKVYSAVLGVITRSGRTPFARLTSPTNERYEDFASFAPFYQEVDALTKELFPKEWGILKDRYKGIKDERYSLFGTIFSSITCNWNFSTCWHRDGQNAKNAVAALVTFDRGEYDGVDFVMAELGLAFHMRGGDILIGDNQGITHAQTPFVPKTEDAENLVLVFYSRDAIVTLDSLECETCRREFMGYLVENHPELGTGEDKWNGSVPSIWGSSYWMDYKALRTEQSRGTDDEYDYTQCSNTNIGGKLDTGEVEIRQPHLIKKTP
jgi:hypothetical protein